jgi:hypothetical protein
MNLFLGNCDFEHHLGPTGPRALSAQIRRLNEEMAFCLVALAEPGDCLWTPQQPDPGFAKHLEEIGLHSVRFVSDARDIPAGAVVVPWGWCGSVATWAAKHGCQHASPDLATVARANSREFSSALETEWNVGLAGARAIRTRADLDGVLSDAAELPGGWVIKANFGMSARERILARSATPRAQDIEWAHRRIERGEPLFFEPWVEAIAEFGCQLSITVTGRPSLEGVTGLLTDPLGTYRGSRLPEKSGRPSGELLEANALAVVERAAERIQQLGYFGPLGIDVMQYRTAGGEIRWRPLQDINARLTMGRVALGLQRLLAPGEWADWLHFRRSDVPAADASSRSSVQTGSLAGVRLVRTSPLEVGGRPVSHGTALLIAPSTELLDTVSP